MVKNKKGGSGHKKLARKNVAPKNGYQSRKLRKPSMEGEMFARVTGIHGGGHAGILCADKVTRTLVIRGKFRGRNKRDNTIRLNSIVLVGLRSVSMGEVRSTKKKEKADLIYVYNEGDMDELKQISDVYNILDDKVRDEVDDNIDFDYNAGENIKLTTMEKMNKSENAKLEEMPDINWDDI
jgi:translation initiation factor IF-1